MTDILWNPTNIENTRMYAFIAFLEERYNRTFKNYAELHRWSVEEKEPFWSSVWDFCEIIGDKGSPPYVFEDSDFKKTLFFRQAQLNFAENLLYKKDSDPAIISWSENGHRRELSYKELYRRVSKMRQYFVDNGLKPYDRVAAMMTNTPEAVICMLAAVSLGAIWLTCSPDFGEQGVLDRLSYLSPRFFIGCRSYFHNGCTHDCLEKIESIAKQLSSQVILVDGDTDESDNKAWDYYSAIMEDYQSQPIIFEKFPFNHPLYILFSSGTTGTPKCIVHGAGGTLIQHLKEHQLHCDIKPGDRVFYFTTCGWMMWNWQVSALASGATLLLYNGSPFHPKRSILLDFAEKEEMTFFGAGSKYFDTLRKLKLNPPHKLEKLRMIASTGGPLVEESFRYIYNSIKKDVCLSSISGGSDIISCFVLGNPMLPVSAGKIQCKGLGMDVAIFDDGGNPILEQKGELVCRSPFPSKPLYFWNDFKGEKYDSAYFNRFNNVWTHGDFAEENLKGEIVIYGRSDTVLNPKGIRIGTAEIYRHVERHEEVVESLVVGQEWKDDIRIILFVILKKEGSFDSSLDGVLKESIRTKVSPHHVPSLIFEAKELPKTKSGKLVESVVREIMNGRLVENTSSLANPACLKEFRMIAINTMRGSDSHGSG